MNKHQSILVSALILLCSLAHAEDAAKDAKPAPSPPPAIAAPVAPQDPNLPLAKVGDTVITAEEFSRFARFRIRRISMEQGKKVEPDGKFRMQAMSELIASHVLEALAKEAKITVTDDEVSKDFAESKKLFKTPEDYDKYLKEQSLTEAQLHDEIYRKLLINKYVELQSKDIKVAPDEVQKEYDDLKSKGKMNRDTKTVDLAQIVALFISGDADSEKAAKEKIEAVRARIVKGEKFEDVGQQVSKDQSAGMQMGLIDEARPESLYPDIRNAVLKLKTGEVSETMKTPRGYGIVAVKTWYEPGVVPFEKVKDKIEEQLRVNKQREMIGGLVKAARERIPIEMYKAEAGEAGAAPAPGDSTPTPPAAPTAPIPAADLSKSQ